MNAPVRPVTIDQALRDKLLLGAALGPADTWETWLSVLRAAFALPLSDQDVTTFESVAGGRPAPVNAVRELWCVVGRRSGKSRIAAALAAYLAAFNRHGNLAPGEVGTILVLAASKTQALAVFRYVVAFFEESPILRKLIRNVTADEIQLDGNIAISVHTNSYRTVRGRTLIAAIFDECAFWRDEASTQPDVETYRAVIPALATTGGMLIAISSPYAQRGLLFSKHQRSFGVSDGETLVVQAGTRVFNPSLDTSIIDKALEEDPESASAEWEANFRGDLSTYIDRAVVERCVEAGVTERPYERKFRYTAFCDPSGGVNDPMTLGISHREGDAAVLDAIREVKPPFAPADVVAEFAAVLKAYRITTVFGDRYAAQWVSDAFKANGIRYSPAEKTRSEIYLEALPQLMGNTFVLLDNTRLVGQISLLERRTTRTGRDSVDHMPGAKDDVANAALGALVHLNTARPSREGPRTRSTPTVNLGYESMKRRRKSGDGVMRK